MVRACAHLSRVSGLERAPDEYGGKRDDVPGFRYSSRSQGVFSISERKMHDGHETGEETPDCQRPYCLCGIDVSPEIPFPSEKTGPVIALVSQGGFSVLATGDDVEVPVCAV